MLTSVADRRGASPETLVDVFDATVGRHSDKTAADDGIHSPTWAEMARWSHVVGAWLTEAGVSPGQRVALCLERDALVPAAIMAVLRAGAVYVAVDPRDPPARRDQMLELAGVTIVLASDRLQAGLPPSVTVVRADLNVVLGAAYPPTPRTPAPVVVTPSDPASLVFTSGSTGQPKPIVLTHGGLVWFARNPSLPALRADDRVGQISSISFDAFHYELWRSVATGAALVSLPHLPEMLSAGIRRQLGSRRVSAMLVPTMAFNHIVEADPRSFDRVRALGVGGDVLSVASVRRLFGAGFPGELYNLYGPAEITTACTIHRVSPADLLSEGIPLGRELDGCDVQLLDELGRPVTDGMPAEATITGPGVASGYFGDSDGDRDRFGRRVVDGDERRTYRSGDVLERRDGLLHFCGRVDDQVKVSGHRVSPAEVESVVRGHPGVDETVVWVDTDAVEPVLVATVVLVDGQDIGEVREHTAQRLPEHLRPQVWVGIETVPATDHGKRDLAALKALVASERARLVGRREPRTETEGAVAGLWRVLLQVDQVGLDDDFFHLGGNSMLLYRLKNLIRDELAVDLSFRQLLSATTLADFAAMVDESR